jgi:hypothetical protein
MSYDPEKWYYDYEPGTTLETIIDRWQKQRPGKDSRGRPLPHQKLYEHSMPVEFRLERIWPYREYTRSKSEGLNTPEEWDALAESLAMKGWSPERPLHFTVYRDPSIPSKVSEGNHRLAIARELGIRCVPVWFHFNHG